MVQAWWTRTNKNWNWKLNCIEKRSRCQFGGITKVLCILSCFQTTESNDQLRCLPPTNCEIGGSNQREKIRISKSQRNRVPPWQCEVSNIFSKTYETIGARLGIDVASPIQPRPCIIGLSFISKFTKFLNGKNFSNNDGLKSHLVEFFAVKDQKFYQGGIMKLPERWQKVIIQNGRYLTD